MIIQQLATMCCEPKSCVVKAAKVLDWITALALLIIGILGVCGVPLLPPAYTYAFIGAGAAYTLSMVLCTGHQIKVCCGGPGGGGSGSKYMSQ
ncbi:MAG TPA: hypothetical protein VIH61_10665 [Waddliaceae bacterium]